MLTKLQLRNFKAWADTGELSLRPITGFFGANSSGKTSLIQALLLLKQTTDSPDRSLVFHFGDHGSPADLGDFQGVVHRSESEIEVSLEWQRDKALGLLDTSAAAETIPSSQRLGFAVVAEQHHKNGSARPRVQQMSYRVGDAVFGLRRRQQKNGDYELFSEGVAFEFIRNRGRPWPLREVPSSYAFPDQVRASFQNAGFVVDLELALKNRLKKVFYLGPLRAQPQRLYTWSGDEPSDMGRAGESVVAALLAADRLGSTVSPGFRRKKLKLEAYVAKWLQELGLIHSFQIKRIGARSQVYEVRVRKTPRADEVLITDVGFGVSQILPVLVLCFYVPEGSTVILEQPEIHLHPAVQSGLADVLIDAWKRRKVQILLESHSEHLIRRLQRRVAEDGDGLVDDIGLFFCDNDGRSSKITRLELNLYGEIQNWPEDFFGDSFSEVAATALAGHKKRKSELP